jgi:septum formation protein
MGEQEVTKASEAAPRLVLASASPRRAQILRQLGIPFRVVISAVEEELLDGETGAAAVERLARAKAEAVARTESSLPVLGADTEVICDGRILGKPDSPEGALEMLAVLAGRRHDVVTGVCLAHNGVIRSAVERTEVAFSPMTEAERKWYVATGEPLDKAGGYHVDGRAAFFIESVSGSPSNVAGLPVRLVMRLAQEAGLALI